MRHHFHPASLALIITCFALRPASAAPGIFDGESDVGATSHAGSVKYDSAQQSYVISGSGANMWFTNDALHFVWKKVSGDFSLAADISFIGSEGDPHRKACLVVRQSLAADSAYADAALHGNGLTSLQYRETNGAMTREIQANISAPTRLRLEKHGQNISMSIAGAGETLHPGGGWFQLPLEGPFYVGLGVCAHESNAVRQAQFSNVEFKEERAVTLSNFSGSTLETVAISSKDRRVVYFTTNHIEAPNWSRDGKYFLFNGSGHILRLPVEGGEPSVVDTGSAIRCNNDHGMSPDGSQLAISDQSQGKGSLIYVLPINGGVPRMITPTGPSYWHGWSPDGRTLAFCGERNKEFDVYTVSIDGGEEKRLTTTPGLDDGPEYSPDGKFIYFNSERTGQMQIWRMEPDGSHQEQVTNDEYNNWFPHISPNGKWLVFLSYDKEVKGHPGSQFVMLRIMPVAGGKIDVLAKLHGGQGTINVPSWSPDSARVAFMSYPILP